jgi:hypothetical protein
MRAKYVAAVKHLQIMGDLGRGDRIHENTFITNNQTLIADLITKEYIPIIGVLEWGFIKDAKAVVWGNMTLENNQDPLRLLNAKLYQTQGFLNSIWLFLDNGIDTEMGFLLYEKGGFPAASSSYINYVPYAAVGTSPIISISREKLQEIRKFHRERFTDEAFGEYPITKVQKSEGRITRALYLVQGARESKDVGVKIMHYCSALETLFATSQGELSHQLSERIAHFIDNIPDKRIETYRMMKKAYSLRSKITHGTALSTKDLVDLRNLSIACDDFLRRSFNQIFSNTETYKVFGSETQLDNYLIELIFGVRSI